MIMDITSPFSKSQLIPQEEKLEIRKKRGQLFIGIPKEDFKIEKRICLTPESVSMLVKAGHKILIEAGAGKEASYDDKKYSEAGATITHDKEKVFGCPIVRSEKIEIRKKRGQLFIGIPKEDFKIEKRICLTPESVSMLVKAGHKILIEAGAGKEASYDDKKYSEAGATITHDKEKVFGCPIVLKVDPPTINEIRLMKPKTYLFSALQLKTQTKEYFEALEKKKITALCYE